LNEPTIREDVRQLNGKLQHASQSIESAASSPSQEELRENTGVQAAHSTGKAAAVAARNAGHAHRSTKLQTRQATRRVERKTAKPRASKLQHRSSGQSPDRLKAGVSTKSAQERLIRQNYAKAFRKARTKREKAESEKTSKETRGLLRAVRFFAKRTYKYIAVNLNIFRVIGYGLAAGILLSAIVTACFTIISGGPNAIIYTSYTAEDADILGADADYTALERHLAAMIGSVERDYPRYDEYIYNIDEIGHDPHVLASYLTAKLNMYTRSEVQLGLVSLFVQQYALTMTPAVETRYRTETYTVTLEFTDPVTGMRISYEHTYEVEVAYLYYILTVTLTNRSLGNVVLSNLTLEQAEMYRVYMETLGNRADLFAGNPYATRREHAGYTVPPEALGDARFAAMLTEAEKHLGMAYVWGGASPATGFDCSGYVSWVINHSGWNVGRLGAKALSNICTPVSPSDAKPGDLVFFWKTYDAPDPDAPTHVGIYVGENMMIHCGNPISYASITTSYWVSKFYGFGRLPGL